MGFLTASSTGELANLTTFVLQQLAQVRTSVAGLTDEQARSVPSASALNLTGLLQHCGVTAAGWSAMARAGLGEPQYPEGLTDRTMEDVVADQRPLADILAEFDRCVAVVTENLGAVTDLSAPVAVPDAPWFPDDLKTWETRWVLAHLVAEIGRHAGHADIIRESIDGKGAFELNALADAESA